MRAVVAIEVLVAIGCHAAPPASSAGAPPAAAPASPVVSIERHDRTVASDPGVAIAFREVIARGREGGVPVVLVHGAGGGGISAFDVPVPGYSMAEELARAGHPAYAIDVRGWGGSTRPPALDAPPDANLPAVGSDEAVRDIAAVVAWVRARWHRPVAVVGWATGGHWAGMFAATQPDAVSHLVMLNAIYGTPGPWSVRARLEDPDRPGQLSKSMGAYTLRDAAALLRTWDTNIPVEDKASWRDPRVAEAYAATAIAADATSAQRTPPSARVPAGPLRDSYLLASGTKMWEARDVRAATLVVRSELDFWSRTEDVAALQRELVNARRVEIAILSGATHTAFLDRPERGRAQWMALLVGFLGRP
jgi:pimeloyl-ACP methyl ester carboxylesterase